MKKVFTILTILLGALLLQATPRVDGCAASWTPFPETEVLSKLTHLLFFQIYPNADGTLETKYIPKQMNEYIARCHSVGTKVIMGVGGAGVSGGFSTSVLPENRSTFVSNLKSFVEQYSLDGLNINWEFPEENEFANYIETLKMLRDSIGNKEISVACSSGKLPTVYPTQFFEVIDIVELMAYDLQDDQYGHSDMELIEPLLETWGTHADRLEAEGVSFSRRSITVGIPFYSRAIGKPEDAIVYKDLILYGASETEDRWEDGGIVYAYNGIPTVKAKTNYALDKGFAGVNIWELSYDFPVNNEYSLLAAIDSAIVNYTETPKDSLFFAPFKVDPATRPFAGKGFNIVPFEPHYPLSDLEKIDFTQFEAAYYAFYTADGSGKPLTTINEPLLKRIVEKAHEVGTKVVLGFAGGSTGTYDPDLLMDTLCEDTARVEAFVSDLMDLMRKYDLDGIDNDWEPFLDPSSKKVKFEHLMEVLNDSISALEEAERIAFEQNDRGEVAFVEKILSAAVISTSGYADQYLSDRSLELMDYIIVMTYHFDADLTKPYTRDINYWTKIRGIPKEKVIPCVAFFGQTSRQWVSGMNSYYFKDILAQDPEAHLKDSAEVYGQTVYYYGHKTLQGLTEFLWNNSGGTAVWSMAADAIGEKSMLNTLHAKRVELLENTAIEPDQFVEKQLSLSVQGMNLTFSNPMGSVEIIASNGRIVEKIALQGTFVTLPSSLAPGVYFLQAKSLTGKIFHSKIAIR